MGRMRSVSSTAPPPLLKIDAPIVFMFGLFHGRAGVVAPTQSGSDIKPTIFVAS